MFLIGSSYTKHRKSFDIDYVVLYKDDTLPKFDNITHIEYHINPILYNYIEKYGNSLEVQYTLKLSHICYDIKWSKHINDIFWFQNNNIKYIPKLYKDLVEYWKKIHGNRKEPNFKQKNETFFYDKVKRTISHDDLHQLVKYYDEPLFNKVKIDKEYAEINEDLFNELTFEDKIKLILEEVYVLTIERNNYNDIKYNPKLMTFNTLKIMILRLLPDWLALFTVLNFKEIHNKSILIKQFNYER